MPKSLLHKVHKSRCSKPYTRVTSRSHQRFSFFHAQDATNLTATWRECAEYEEFLGIQSLEEMIINLAKELGRKITILDSGCGSCVVIGQLLSNERLQPYIEHISGISLHYFAGAKLTMENHPYRFSYYSGTAQSVLSNALEMHNAFDLI